MILNRTSVEIESYDYWEYQYLIKNYIELKEKKDNEQQGIQQII